MRDLCVKAPSITQYLVQEILKHSTDNSEPKVPYIELISKYYNLGKLLAIYYYYTFYPTISRLSTTLLFIYFLRSKYTSKY
jgi:hypothetical protein